MLWVRSKWSVLQQLVLCSETATHSSILAWRIPGTEEPSGLLSMGSHRVGHNWSDLVAAAAAADKESAGPGFDPWVGKIPWKRGNGYPLQYSCLESSMDRGAWQATVHGIAKGWTRLSDFTFTFHFLALEKEMAIQSSVLVWRIPGIGEPGGLLSMGSHRVGHNWRDLAAAAAAAWSLERWYWWSYLQEMQT